MAQTLLMGMPMNFEPKRENRFVLEFPSELGIETWKVQSVSAIKMNINPVEINFLNTVQNVAGIYKWEAITIELLDSIGPSTTVQLMEWVRLHAESMTGRMGYAIGYKKDLILKSLDPTGVEVDKWVLEQCMVTSAEFGTNSMESDAVKKVTITVQPFRCINLY